MYTSLLSAMLFQNLLLHMNALMPFDVRAMGDSANAYGQIGLLRVFAIIWGRGMALRLPLGDREGASLLIR